MSGDHERSEPVPADEELFVAFANSLELEGGGDRRATVKALTDWLAARALLGQRERAVQAARLRDDRVAAEQQLGLFTELQRVTRAIAVRADQRKPPTRAQLRDLNRALRDGLHYHQLELADDGSRYRVSQVGDRLDQARAAIAGSLAHFLADHDASRLRVCDNERCRWLFIDRSPAGRRRWCDMRICGNRAKVARHRARRRRPDP